MGCYPAMPCLLEVQLTPMTKSRMKEMTVQRNPSGQKILEPRAENYGWLADPLIWDGPSISSRTRETVANSAATE